MCVVGVLRCSGLALPRRLERWQDGRGRRQSGTLSTLSPRVDSSRRNQEERADVDARPRTRAISQTTTIIEHQKKSKKSEPIIPPPVEAESESTSLFIGTHSLLAKIGPKLMGNKTHAHLQATSQTLLNPHLLRTNKAIERRLQVPR